MNYYIKENKVNSLSSQTAWSKAREDAGQICASLGFSPVCVMPAEMNRTDISLPQKIRQHFVAGKLWSGQLKTLREGDELLIQLPVINNCLYLAQILADAKKRGVKLIALVHDLEMLRMEKDKNMKLRTRARMWIEEKSVLKLCDRVIVHNHKILRYMEDCGLPGTKMTELGIFDYLIPEEVFSDALQNRKPDFSGRMIVAGNLSPEKAGYVYNVPENVHLNLYGVYYKNNDRTNLHYHGSFAPEELPLHLHGSFGLVWDGPSAETCTGPYGEYLRYNNPHKTSLYLACGIPVVIWKEAALAQFVEREKVGITAGSIAEAARKISEISEETYLEYLNNAQMMSEKLRCGSFLAEAIADR